MDDMWWIVGFFFVSLMTVLLVKAFRSGKREGARLERLRCGTILQRSMYVRYSPTTKIALECIYEVITPEHMEAKLFKLKGE